MFLSANELRELTGFARPKQQMQALRLMGIKHNLRPDGKVVVLKSLVEELMGGHQPQKSKTRTPDFSAI